ncbi:16S rRNA methyltransferase [Thalassotalea sp. HSM 43]|uniref:methyltransferase n=1 Tax=Thalassotalea sp. HSM 43 TaxID=2552945 RepID=UPI001080EB88|nr:methyltransferase [Thalassotalea sp. HSM 43]QBY04955.1 16S rRNA methyltransferase [Thalassotalea sp. HSM 43]
MAVSNPSQLLLRNTDLLDSKHPLVVGCPDVELIKELTQLYPDAKVTSYQINYAQHQAISKACQNVHCEFGEQYQSKQQHDLVIFYFPKSKPEFTMQMAMLSNSLSDNAIVLFVGENKGGVKSAAKLAADYALRCDKVDSARHCLLYEMVFNNNRSAFVLDDWYRQYQIQQGDTALTICALPGVFSHAELDIGTQLLLQHIPDKVTGKVLDFGCGAGVIGCYIKMANRDADIEMIDVNALAIASAEKTLAVNKLSGNVYASDGLSNVGQGYQLVVSNPPFHQGLKTHYQTTEVFLQSVKNKINKNGKLTIVANSFLKYAPIIEKQFGHSNLLANHKGFAIHQAQKR